MDGGRREFTFLWFIENYSHCWLENGEELGSPAFTENGLEGTTWRLYLYPRGKRVEDKGFISLHLRRCLSDDGPENASVKFELSVLAADGSTISSKEQDCSFRSADMRGWGDFLRLDEILFQRHFPQDVLTVRCKMWRGEGNVHRVSHACARTRIGIEKVSLLHEVEHFSTLLSNQNNTINIYSSDRYQLASSSLYFTNNSGHEGKMIVKITPDMNIHKIPKRKISLLGSGNIIVCGEDDNRFDVTRKVSRKLPLSITRQEILNKKSEYLPDDKLSLLCEFSFFTGLEFEKIEETQYEMPTAAAKRTNNQKVSKNDDNTVELSKNDDNNIEKASAYPSALEDMKSLYVDQCLSDVELKTKTKSFPAHKNILCARSPVFKRMMTCDMKEKNADCIQVDDLQDDVVQQLLLFLYSDTVENLQWEMATQLYYAADKYQVGKLKEVCSSFLLENLSPTNAGELLLLADTHSDRDLKKSVEDFILEHEKEVFGSKEWEMLMETNPLLVMKTMHLKYKR